MPANIIAATIITLDLETLRRQHQAWRLRAGESALLAYCSASHCVRSRLPMNGRLVALTAWLKAHPRPGIYPAPRGPGRCAQQVD